MFTGIIQGIATVIHIEKKSGLHTLTLQLPSRLCHNLKAGISIAIEGTCLTLTHDEGDHLQFDVMQETLDKTTLGSLSVGDKVNVERSVKYGDEIGGHAVSGHVHGMGEIIGVEQPDNNYILKIKLPPPYIDYVFEKGFIALAGASLTVVRVDRDRSAFSVNLIPETLENTTLGLKQPTEKINFEVEQSTYTLVETVRNFLKK